MADVTVAPAPSQRIRLEAFALMDTADREGIDLDGPLGSWVRSQHAILLSLADAMEHLDVGIGKTMRNTKDLAATELRRLQKSTEAAVVLCERLKAEREVLSLRSEQAVADFMKSVTPRVVEALKMVTVIRERRWNARQNVVGVCVALATVLGLFGAGFLVGGGDFKGRSGGAAAQAAVDRCIAAAQPDRASGEKWCPVSVLEAPRP
jgi:hypothetical protein